MRTTTWGVAAATAAALASTTMLAAPSHAVATQNCTGAIDYGIQVCVKGTWDEDGPGQLVQHGTVWLRDPNDRGAFIVAAQRRDIRPDGTIDFASPWHNDDVGWRADFGADNRMPNEYGNKVQGRWTIGYRCGPYTCERSGTISTLLG